MHFVFLSVSDLQGSAAQLATSASSRILQGFRPATLRQYTRMWTDFLSFQVVAGLPPCQVNTYILLAFMEFLVRNHHSKSSITNYLVATRAFHIIHGLNTQAFRDQRIQLFLKSLTITAPLTPANRASLDIQILERTVIECQSHPHPIVFKPLYLLCFFSFLRLSNILPHSIRTFDYTRQLARGDFIPSQAGAVVLLKWSKTIQDRKTTQTIPLPHLGASPLCPITAILAMTHEIVANPNDPLFIVPSPNQVPLTDSVARKHLKKISTALNISPPLTFHAFRRAGASWAFKQGVPLEHIMKHGTWRSDAIWSYLSSSPSLSSPVSIASQSALRL